VNRFLVPLGAFALLAVVLGVGVYKSADKGTIASPLIGKPAPAFELASLTEPQRRMSSQELKGRAYLLNVWGSWCIACREEHEMLLSIRKSGRVPLIGLNWQDQDSAALEWLEKLGNPYEIVLVDRDGRTAIDLGVYGAPESFLVDPSGIVIYKHVGPITEQVWRSDILPRLPQQ
jgi:cytochrome c biogenesis protein CcmG/thiol:disulfide interchange protein DsbE